MAYPGKGQKLLSHIKSRILDSTTTMNNYIFSSIIHGTNKAKTIAMVQYNFPLMFLGCEMSAILIK